MLEKHTNGDRASAPSEAVAAGHEDQGGGAELGLVLGGRAAPAGVRPDPELAEQAKRRWFSAK